MPLAIVGFSAKAMSKMGVDAYIFAEKSKKYFDFDRLYNFRIHLFEEDEAPGVNIDIHNALLGLTDNQGRVCSDEIVWLAENNMVYWAAETARQKEKYGDSGRDYTYKVKWNEQIKRFALMFPDDKFFIVTDHEDPSNWDIAKEGGYEEVEIK